MSLAPGAKLGPYEVVAPIGAGGMGEVFRALDTRLDRTVAIKVLPADLAGDAQFRERFDREARAISSLQHPHICTLFDVGHQDGIDFLVLEFIDGETLAARLARSSALSVPDALQCAIEICDALDRAHRSGIVHRDLKPANVMLTKSGVKLLDFGLAKVAAPVVATSTVSILPTTPAHVTAQGTILGTFQYMAPEQIEGLEVDARTDIFAFGALLYETMTGRKAFEGKTRASLLGAILKDEAPRPSAVQPLSSPALDRVVTTCLAKDPDDRYQSARDLLRELKWIASGAPEAAVRNAAPAQRRTPWIPWSIAAAALLAFAAAGTLALRHVREVSATPAAAVQFTIAPPAEVTFATPPAGGTGVAPQLAISPDERNLVFVGSSKNGYQLWLRPIAALDATPIPGTEGAAFPFWSPDSRFIGFFADNKLKKVNVGGGPPTPLCTALLGRGGTWNRDNVIIFAQSGGGQLQRVSSNGGAPQPVSTIDAAWGETSHRFPSFLPDGRHFLYTGTTGICCPAPKPGRLRLGSLDSPDAITVQQVDSSGIFASGHLLFVLADGTLMAQPFDAATLKASGDPFPIAERVSSEGSRYGSFSASATGLLVYAHGAARPTTQLTWMDRGGKVLGTVGPADSYFAMSLSADEQHVAVSLWTGTPPNRDIWVLDTARGIRSRLTFDPADDNFPIWSPDDSQLVFSGNRDGMMLSTVLVRQNVRGTTKEEILKTPGAINPSPTDWSADGQYILFVRASATTALDLWALPLTGNQQPFAVLQTPFPENNAVLAPGGRWLAYVSPETGSPEVFVQPFPPTGRKFQVSRAGGTLPIWRRDGKELFFVSGDSQLMAAPTEITNQFVFGEPMALFAFRSVYGLGPAGRQYAPSKDGRRFLVNAVQQAAVQIPLNVVINWPSTIAR